MLDDSLPAVARSGSLRSLNPTQSRDQLVPRRGRETHAVCDIGDRIAVRINLEFVQSPGREGVACGGPRRVHAGGRVYVHDQDRLASVPWLGKGIQIGEIQAGVPMRKPKIGTGVMVRHRSSPLTMDSQPLPAGRSVRAMDRRKGYSPRVSTATHTFLGATRSVFRTSVISRIRCHPALFCGFARKVSRYWCASRFATSSRNGVNDTGGPVNPM